MKKLLLTAEELAVVLQIRVKSVRRAYTNGDIPVERVCRFVRFDLDAVKAALRRKGKLSVQRCLSAEGQRSATGGDSRRRAQRTRPRLGKTGASIAQHSVREFDRLSEFSCQLSVELNWNSGAEFPSGHSRLTDQVQPFGLRAPGDPTIRGIEQSHTYACCDQIFAKESDCMPTVHRTRL